MQGKVRRTDAELGREECLQETASDVEKEEYYGLQEKHDESVGVSVHYEHY